MKSSRGLHKKDVTWPENVVNVQIIVSIHNICWVVFLLLFFLYFYFYNFLRIVVQ